MKGINQIREDLLVMYKEWANEFKEIDNGRFLTEQYSNPYYISIPDNWFDNNVRIMIVGEEGFGEWGADSWAFDDFEKIINYNRIKTLKQGDETKLMQEELNLCSETKSAFWFWFKRIYNLCDNLRSSFVWNNFDKIHRLKNEKCQLTYRQRERLHSTKTKILREEIKLLEPTIILFFGWRSSLALKEELGDEFAEVYNTLCPNGQNNEKYKQEP